MDDVRLRFTVCWFVDEAWVDLHLARGEQNFHPERLGRLIFSKPRGLAAWCALAKVVQEHNGRLMDGVIAVVTGGAPDTVNYAAIPASIMRALIDHVEHGSRTGDYLTAVLENNLVSATARADEHSYAALRDTVSWLTNHAPPDCWGNPEKVQQWRDAHRRAESLGPAEQGPRPTESPAADTEATP